MTLTEIGSALLPWKEALTGVVGILSDIVAVGIGIWKQSRKPNTSYTEPPAAPQARGTMFRLDPADREAVADLRESVSDLTRAVRHTSKVVEDQTDALDRLGRMRTATP